MFKNYNIQNYLKEFYIYLIYIIISSFLSLIIFISKLHLLIFFYSFPLIKFTLKKLLLFYPTDLLNLSFFLILNNLFLIQFPLLFIFIILFLNSCFLKNQQLILKEFIKLSTKIYLFWYIIIYFSNWNLLNFLLNWDFFPSFSSFSMFNFNIQILNYLKFIFNLNFQFLFFISILFFIYYFCLLFFSIKIIYFYMGYYKNLLFFNIILILFFLNSFDFLLQIFLIFLIFLLFEIIYFFICFQLSFLIPNK